MYTDKFAVFVHGNGEYGCCQQSGSDLHFFCHFFQFVIYCPGELHFDIGKCVMEILLKIRMKIPGQNTCSYTGCNATIGAASSPVA